jgi:hypothetical protein
MTISFHERPGPPNGPKEDRYLNETPFRWARPFPRTGCALARAPNPTRRSIGVKATRSQSVRNARVGLGGSVVVRFGIRAQGNWGGKPLDGDENPNSRIGATPDHCAFSLRQPWLE